jgi:hypothetical protein
VHGLIVFLISGSHHPFLLFIFGEIPGFMKSNYLFWKFVSFGFFLFLEISRLLNYYAKVFGFLLIWALIIIEYLSFPGERPMDQESINSPGLMG